MPESISEGKFVAFVRQLEDTVRIDSLRRLFIVELIILLVLIQIFHVLRPWPKVFPFSNYPMFSYSREKETKVEWMRLGGVTPDGGEIGLQLSKCFLPLDRISFANSIIYEFGDSEEKRKNLDTLMRELFAIYRDNREAGFYGCPDLIGIKVYRITWDWTGVPAERTKHTDELIYSLINGKSQHYQVKR